MDMNLNVINTEGLSIARIDWFLEIHDAVNAVFRFIQARASRPDIDHVYLEMVLFVYTIWIWCM